MGNLKTTLASLAATLALSGCMTAPPKAYTIQQPQTAPMRNLTSMDLALSCLDRQLRDHNVPHKRLTSPGIPSRAGDKLVLGSGLDMLKTSIGQLSLSNVYTFMDLSAISTPGVINGEANYRPLDVNAINTWGRYMGDHHLAFSFPDRIITGSISQADNNVTSDQVSGGLDAGGTGNAQAGVGGSMNQGVTVVTVDMQILDIPSLEVVSGLTTKNSIAVVRSSTGADLSGHVSALGAHFNVNLDRTEGMHQAVRILIQLGTVELLGRLAGVPYEQCLTGETVQANAVGKAQEAFDDMETDVRTRFVQQQLSMLADSGKPGHPPYYTGPLNGVEDSITRNAIARYQKDAGLVASGRVDLDLYRSLQHRLDNTPAKPIPSVPQPPVSTPLLTLQAVPGSVVKPGTTLAVNLSVDRDAHVQCFLQNDKQEIFRIFPTAEQPDDLLMAGMTVTAPSPASPRQIVMDTLGLENIGCVVSDGILTAGDSWPIGPLGSTPVSAPSLHALSDQYRRAAAGAIAFGELPIQVQ